MIIDAFKLRSVPLANIENNFITSFKTILHSHSARKTEKKFKCTVY